MAKPVSQSRTMWVKKGTVVNGKKVKKGYVAQYGKPEKRVTARIRLEQDTSKRGSKGDVVKVTKGRYKAAKPKAEGGGVTSAQAAAARRRSSSGSKVTQTTKTTKPASTSRTGLSSSAANRGGYSAKGYQRRLGSKISGSGSDAVNAKTSSGSAKTSSVHDSFIPKQGVRGRSPLGKGRPQQATANRPTSFRGSPARLQKSKSGQLRWVKVVK